MNFDSLMLAAVSHELQADVVPGRVERVTQPAPLEVIIQLFAHSRKRSLLISVDPNMARIHVTDSSRANPPSPPAFCMLLRKHLTGAWLEGIEHPFGVGERVVKLTFLPSTSEHLLLFVELMGKHSNIILTTADLKILGSIKTITTQTSRFREVRPGLKYYPPPRMRSTKRDAFQPDAGDDLPDESFETEPDAAQWLMANFSGVSPLMSREAVARAEPPLTSGSVWRGLSELAAAVRNADYAPVQIREQAGSTPGAYPLPLRSVPASAQQRWASFNGAIDDAASSAALADALGRERAALVAALKKAQKTCERELIDTSEGLANAERADEYKQIGDLLLARARDVPAGAETVALEDYFADDGPASRVISLDPRLTAVENAKRYYARHRKARDSEARLLERQVLLTQTAETISAAMAHAVSAETLGQLNAISTGLGGDAQRRMRQIAGDKPAERANEDPLAGHKIQRIHSVDGWEILVGENAVSNDYLTTRIALPNDIWLHARAIPSAHAVIRAQNRPASVSSAALRLAAEQVARRSDAKHARLVPVDYTLKKYVRKPRGAEPGAVTYSHEKTLDVTPSEA